MWAQRRHLKHGVQKQFPGEYFWAEFLDIEQNELNQERRKGIQAIGCIAPARALSHVQGTGARSARWGMAGSKDEGTRGGQAMQAPVYDIKHGSTLRVTRSHQRDHAQVAWLTLYLHTKPSRGKFKRDSKRIEWRMEGVWKEDDGDLNFRSGGENPDG